MKTAKTLLVIATLLLAFSAGCKETDWREPYTGSFDFMCRSSFVSMCQDTNPDCVDGWMESQIDTSYYTSEVVIQDSDRVKIQIGSMTLSPILEKNGTLVFPSSEYPSGGNNNYNGQYMGTDSIVISITAGLTGMYTKYHIIGKKVLTVSYGEKHYHEPSPGGGDLN